MIKKLFRLRKIGTMTYYAGSRYEKALFSRTGRIYKRRCDLSNSIRLVKDFQPHEWELQTFDVVRGAVEHPMKA